MAGARDATSWALGPARLLAAADLRRRWASILAVGLLASLIGGVVLSAVAGARRTSSAFDRLLQETRYWDVRVDAFSADSDLVDDVIALPQVERGWGAELVVGHFGETVQFLAVTVGPERDAGIYRPVVVEGRAARPDAPEEVVIGERMSAELGLGVGTRFRFEALSPEQFQAFGEFEFTSFDGPRVDLHVVGVVREPTGALGDGPVALGTPALRELLDGRAGGARSALVQLRHDPAAAAAFTAAVEDLAGTADPAQRFVPVTLETTAELRQGVDDTTRVLTNGLLVFAGLAGAAGLLVLFQVLVRNLAPVAANGDVHTALGMTRGQRVAAMVIPRIAAATVAALTAAVLAVAASPLTPFGAARRLEPRPGPAVDAVVLAVGVPAVFLCVVALTALAGARLTRTATAGAQAIEPRIPALAASLSRVGGPPPAVVGVRMALEPGAGRRAVPVRSSLVGAVVGIAGVVTCLGFAASLDRLLDTPGRYGKGVHATVELADDVEGGAVASLEGDPDIEALALATSAPIEFEGRATSAYGFDVRRGTIGFTLLSGRAAAGPDEAVVGPELLESVGAEVGDRVDVSDGRGGSRAVQVVGTGLGWGYDSDTYRTGVAMTPEGLERSRISETYSVAYLRYRPGIDVEERVQALALRYETSTPIPPPEVDNLGQIGRLPELLGLFLAVLAASAVTHALVVTVSRRRHDLAVLRSLGFTAGQTSRALLCMAATTAGVAVVVGVPCGLLAARAVWSQVAGGVDVATDLAVPWAALVALVPLTLALAAVVAAAPAWTAGRLHVVELLRPE